jgi:zinc and cadmium transporter
VSLLLWIILFSLLGGVLSVLAAAVFLLLPEKIRLRAIPHFVSFAIGALLGASFLALLPHALMQATDFHSIGLAVLLGILAFFILEKMVLWRHCHAEHCEAHSPERSVAEGKAAGSLILIGDALHNFVDGVLIAAAFLTDIHLGIVTSLAIAAHEIPQEVGDFAVLLHSGFSRTRAFVFNVISSLATVVGALIGYMSLDGAQSLLPYVLAVAASSFIYIAVADLIPGLHKRIHLSATLQQVGLIILGVAVIYLAHSTLH